MCDLWGVERVGVETLQYFVGYEDFCGLNNKKQRPTMEKNYWMIGLIVMMLVLPQQAILPPRKTTADTDSDDEEIGQFDYLMDALKQVKDKVPYTLLSIIVTEQECFEAIGESKELSELKAKSSLTEEEQQRVKALKISKAAGKRKCIQQRNKQLKSYLAEYGPIEFSPTEVDTLAQAENALKSMITAELSALDQFIKNHEGFQDQRQKMLQLLQKQAPDLEQEGKEMLKEKKHIKHGDSQRDDQSTLQKEMQQIQRQIKQQEEQLRQINAEIKEENLKLKQEQMAFKKKAKSRKKQRIIHSLQMQVATFSQQKQEGTFTKEKCENLDALIKKLVGEAQLGKELTKMTELYSKECLGPKSPPPLQPKSPVSHPGPPAPVSPSKVTPKTPPTELPSLIPHPEQIVPFPPKLPPSPKPQAQKQKRVSEKPQAQKQKKISEKPQPQKQKKVSEKPQAQKQKQVPEKPQAQKQKQVPEKPLTQKQKRLIKYALKKIQLVMNMASRQNRLLPDSCKKLQSSLNQIKQLWLDEAQRQLYEKGSLIYTQLCIQGPRRIQIIARMEELTKKKTIPQDECQSIKKFVDQVLALDKQVGSGLTPNERLAARNLQLLYVIQCQYEAGQLQSALMSAQQAKKMEDVSGKFDLSKCDELKAVIAAIEGNSGHVRKTQQDLVHYVKQMYLIYCKSLPEGYSVDILWRKANNIVLQINQEQKQKNALTEKRCIEGRQSFNAIQSLPQKQLNEETKSIKIYLNLFVNSKCKQIFDSMQKKLEEEKKRIEEEKKRIEEEKKMEEKRKMQEEKRTEEERKMLKKKRMQEERKMQQERRRQEESRWQEQEKTPQGKFKNIVARCRQISVRFKEIKCEQMHDLLLQVIELKIDSSSPEEQAIINEAKKIYAQKCKRYQKMLQIIKQAQKPRAKLKEVTQKDLSKAQMFIQKIELVMPPLQAKRKAEVDNFIASLGQQVSILRLIIYGMSTIPKHFKDDTEINEQQYQNLKQNLILNKKKIGQIIEKSTIQTITNYLKNFVEQKIQSFSKLASPQALANYLKTQENIQKLQAQIKTFKVVRNFKDVAKIISVLQNRISEQRQLFQQLKQYNKQKSPQEILQRLHKFASLIKYKKIMSEKDKMQVKMVIRLVLLKGLKLNSQEEQQLLVLKDFLALESLLVQLQQPKTQVWNQYIKQKRADISKKFQLKIDTIAQIHSSDEQRMHSSPEQDKKQTPKKSTTQLQKQDQTKQ